MVWWLKVPVATLVDLFVPLADAPKYPKRRSVKTNGLSV
jgi:hypothetical protein